MGWNVSGIPLNNWKPRSSRGIAPSPTGIGARYFVTRYLQIFNLLEKSNNNPAEEGVLK